MHVSDAIARTGLSLPSSVVLQEDDIDLVVERLSAILRLRRLATDASVARH